MAETEKENVIPIGAPHPEKVKKLEELVQAYKDGKCQAIALVTGSEDGSTDSAWMDGPAHSHSLRTLYCQLDIVKSVIIGDALL